MSSYDNIFEELNEMASFKGFGKVNETKTALNKTDLCRLEQPELIKLIENNELVLIDDVAEYIAYITCPVNVDEIGNIKDLITLNKEMLLNWLENKQDNADYDKAMQDIGKTYTHEEVKGMLEKE